MKAKGCELCPGTARMYCESDEARLCFDCDAKVHGANFLVARHSRVLLCRSCQAPTPWKASGPRLGPTVSVCDGCVGGSAGKSQEEGEGESGERAAAERGGRECDDDCDEVGGGGGGGDRVEDDDDDDDDDEETDEDRESEDEDDEDEEGEEQVVPWSPEPPPVTSSSSSEEEEEEESVGRIVGAPWKRMRENVHLPSPSSQDQLPCSSSRPSLLPNRTVEDEEASSDSFRPFKDRKLDLIGKAVSLASVRPPI